ncbi:MAG: penicillin-binding transpeptidase domain-containing protein [bacterium]
MLSFTNPYRLILVGVAFALGFLALGARVSQLQWMGHERYLQQATDQQTKRILVRPQRGMIFDRKGRILATNTARESLYIYPTVLEHGRAALASRLADALDLPVRKVLDRLHQKGTLPLARKLAPEKVQEVLALSAEFHLPRNFMFFVKDNERTYPTKLAPHVVGFTTLDKYGSDNIGLAGIELAYDPMLRGRSEETMVEVNAGRIALEPVEDDKHLATQGFDLTLTIDSNIQHVAERALQEAVGENQAKGGVCIVQETSTGAILALASCPTFDPMDFSRASDFQRRNRAFDPIEPGSVQKIFTYSLLFENNLLSQSEIVDCEGGSWHVDGRSIKDAGHYFHKITAYEAFVYSSNVAAVKFGMRLPASDLYYGLCNFGFGVPTGIDLPGDEPGILYPLSKWTKLSRSSLPFGYELALTGMQVLCATSSVGNGGILYKPYVVKEITSPDGRVIRRAQPTVVGRTVSEPTTLLMKDFMAGVVKEGTGKKAAVPGYTVGGKTGTTRKSDRLARLYVSSFAGFAPFNNPVVTCYVYIDEPSASEYYGGDVAAPVFSQVMSEALRQLAVPPDAPVAEVADSDTNSDANPVDDESAGPADSANVPADPEFTGKRMPDLTGLTRREVLEIRDSLPRSLDLTGEGVVVKQDPLPNDPLTGFERCRVFLSLPTETLFSSVPAVSSGQRGSAFSLEENQ